ncbi:ParB/RepB/Spo0J family partition protein [Patescibacteria group bacterium]|nr:MAG: ParB/RepB/Spo0J family partition protein [Patescibacteria group bacterium]
MALGRGLGSLIPGKQTITEQVIPSARREVTEIPVAQVRPNPRQPRAHFAPEELADLVASIKEHGVLQPVIVTRVQGGYELVAGERRLRASMAAGLGTVPAIVRDATEQQKLEWALIENVQRADLNAVEEALAYKALIEEFNFTQEDTAKRVGKSRSAVANVLRLLDLPEEMLIAIRGGRLSKSHARTLLAEPDEAKRRALYQAMLSGGVSVREAEARVSHASAGKRPSSAGKKDPNIAAHEKRLREILGTKVSIQEKGGKGKITIEFYSKEELIDLLDKLSE